MRLKLTVMALLMPTWICGHAVEPQDSSIRSQRTLPEEEKSTPIPHLLRDHVVDGLEEWEFLPDGKMLLYSFSLNDFAASLKNHTHHGKVYPFLSVECRKWKMEGGKLMFGRGHQWAELGYNGPRVGYMIWEHGHTEEEHLEFFNTLISYCGDSILRDAQEKVKKLGRIEERHVKPPFKFLHSVTAVGFTEYEFRSDGRLFSYYDMENCAKNGDNISFGERLERFKVELLTWRREKDQIVVGHGDKDEVMHISNDGKEVTSEGSVWKPMEHLEFISRIFAFCEKPLPKIR